MEVSGKSQREHLNEAVQADEFYRVEGTTRMSNSEQIYLFQEYCRTHLAVVKQSQSCTCPQ